MRGTAVEGVLSARADTVSLDALREHLDSLLSAAAARDEKQTLACLSALEPEFTPT